MIESLRPPPPNPTSQTPAPVTDAGEFMSLADAVANCQVKAKKTIVRWAKADGIRERYGRSGASTIERVVPVDWIRGKMAEKGLTAPPIYEPVELIENVSFTKNDNVQPLGSKVPALFSEEAPQLMVGVRLSVFDRVPYQGRSGRPMPYEDSEDLYQITIHYEDGSRDRYSS